MKCTYNRCLEALRGGTDKSQFTAGNEVCFLRSRPWKTCKGSVYPETDRNSRLFSRQTRPLRVCHSLYPSPSSASLRVVYYVFVGTPTSRGHVGFST